MLLQFSSVPIFNVCVAFSIACVLPFVKDYYLESMEWCFYYFLRLYIYIFLFADSRIITQNLKLLNIKNEGSTFILVYKNPNINVACIKEYHRRVGEPYLKVQGNDKGMS